MALIRQDSHMKGLRPRFPWQPLGCALLFCLAVNTGLAQTAWPPAQIAMYPHTETMRQTRPEQTVLLGEGEQQTGVFFSSIDDTSTDVVQAELIADAKRKQWQLLSAIRRGSGVILSFTQNDRILDLRMTQTDEGVSLVYSVMLRQRPKSP